MRSLMQAAVDNKRATVLWALVIVAVLIGTFIATARATDKASFCITCHEMTPFYDAWSEGAHAGVSCVECHVGEGGAERVTHKFEALREVYSHFVNEPLFPMNATEIPDARCLSCHDGPIDPGVTGFDHEVHRGGKSCTDCHADIGHRVTAEALADAGVLDVERQAEKEARVVVTAGAGEANLPDHITVNCSSCHDMAQTGCSTCHTPEHEPRDPSTTCTDCHSAGTEWTFSHPSRPDCATCHETPEAHYTPTCETCHAPGDFGFEHPAAGATCESCHERPAEHRAGECESCHTTMTDWTFAHPAANATCESCHERPAGHAGGTCTTCHAGTSSWRFAHPSSQKCASCHKAPARHYQGSCSACHTSGKPFASAVFKHPGASATCTDCHSQPAKHAAGTCSTCHRTGASWKFAHPSSASCASCHKPPSTHYGTSCSSCHTPAKSWGSATFDHARIPGGEHTYRSFSCATCHPGGYTSYSCLKCHSNNSGGDDDDDDDD